MADDEFLGGEKAVISDTRDFAIVVTVDHHGIADARANGVEKPQAAEWLRAIADLWDPPAGPSPVPEEPGDGS